MSILLKLIYRFNTIPINISVLFCRNWQANSKIYVEKQEPKIAKRVVEKKNKTGGLILPDDHDLLNGYNNQDSTVLAYV